MALLLGVTMVSLTLLTAAVGTVVEGNAARADTARVAADLDAALEPIATTGVDRGRVAFSRGTLRPVERDLRVLNGTGVVRAVAVDALVFEADGRRVGAVAGAIVTGRPGNARLYRPPPITASRGAGVLVVGAARLGSPETVSGRGGVTTRLRTRVEHDRERLGNGTYRVAIETATPEAFGGYLEGTNATVRVRDIDGDGTPSVVAAYPGERVAFLVVHDLHAEVGA